LYESLGFQHLDETKVTLSPYDRADVYMEMNLELNHKHLAPPTNGCRIEDGDMIVS
jgi:hypothetical protein